MQVLVPTKITGEMLTASTAPEPEAGVTAWAAATTYAENAIVYLPAAHRKYRAVTAITGAAGNKSPDDPTAFPAQWADAGPTNRWMMFDAEVSTKTVVASPLTVTLKPGAFNSLTMFGLDGSHIEVSVKDKPGGVEVYRYEGPLENSQPPDYWEYFFAPFKPQTDIVLSNIPTYNGAEVTVTITSGGTVKAGVLAVGDLRPLGKTLYGARAKPVDYSYIKVDEFGNNKIMKRKNAKDMDATVWLKLSEANVVLETLMELLGVPCVWIATDGSEYSGLRTFGLGSGEISYDHPQDVMLTVNVKGLI